MGAVDDKVNDRSFSEFFYNDLHCIECSLDNILNGPWDDVDRLLGSEREKLQEAREIVLHLKTLEEEK